MIMDPCKPGHLLPPALKTPFCPRSRKLWGLAKPLSHTGLFEKTNNATTNYFHQLSSAIQGPLYRRGIVCLPVCRTVDTASRSWARWGSGPGWAPKESVVPPGATASGLLALNSIGISRNHSGLFSGFKFGHTFELSNVMKLQGCWYMIGLLW